jgi:hypothetical protein
MKYALTLNKNPVHAGVFLVAATLIIRERVLTETQGPVRLRPNGTSMDLKRTTTASRLAYYSRTRTHSRIR